MPGAAGTWLTCGSTSCSATRIATPAHHDVIREVEAGARQPTEAESEAVSRAAVVRHRAEVHRPAAGQHDRRGGGMVTAIKRQQDVHGHAIADLDRV
jgi:hypothetical protein